MLNIKLIFPVKIQCRTDWIQNIEAAYKRHILNIKEKRN